MMGHQTGGQDQLFYAFNLEDHIPSNHLLRGVKLPLKASSSHGLTGSTDR